MLDNLLKRVKPQLILSFIIYSAIGHTVRYGISYDRFGRTCPSNALLMWSFGTLGNFREGKFLIVFDL